MTNLKNLHAAFIAALRSYYQREKPTIEQIRSNTEPPMLDWERLAVDRYLGEENKMIEEGKEKELKQIIYGKTKKRQTPSSE